MAPGDAAVVIARVDAPAAAHVQVDARAPRPARGVDAVDAAPRRGRAGRAPRPALGPGPDRGPGRAHGAGRPDPRARPHLRAGHARDRDGRGRRARDASGGVTTSRRGPGGDARRDALAGGVRPRARRPRPSTTPAIPRADHEAHRAAASAARAPAGSPSRATPPARRGPAAVRPGPPRRARATGADDEDRGGGANAPCRRSTETLAPGEAIEVRGVRRWRFVHLPRRRRPDRARARGDGDAVDPAITAPHPAPRRRPRRHDPDRARRRRPHRGGGARRHDPQPRQRPPVDSSSASGPRSPRIPASATRFGLHLGRKLGLALRWDGAVLFGDAGAFHRGAATLGVELSW